MNVLTMLSVEERQLLYWLASEYYSGGGAIVDAGCFAGGSTLALAEGLRKSRHKAVIDVYDRFEVEPYMLDFYFKGADLIPGDSFRDIFESNTASVRDLLDVHPGDLTTGGWSGGPIEVLFIDIAKSWALNDYIVDEFFPSLIPGRSVVVQQDYVYAGCPWVALTMEYLSDYFEPMAFAEYCSVVYLCRRRVPRGLPPVSGTSHASRMDLMDRAAARFRGYPRHVLDCAKATLLLEHGDAAAADEIVVRVSSDAGEHYSVEAAVDFVASLREHQPGALRRSQPSG